MLKQVRGGKLSVEAAVDRLRTLPYEDLGYAKIDHHRSLRQGFPEVVFARGKDPAQVEGIVRRMLRNKHNILVTRGDRSLYELLRPLDPKVEFHALSGAISIRRERKIRGKGKGSGGVCRHFGHPGGGGSTGDGRHHGEPHRFPL